MSVTRFGLQIPNFTYSGVHDEDLFAKIAKIAKTAEGSGFDSLFVMDHFYQIAMVGARTEPMLEAYTLLGAIAAVTTRINLGAMVTGVTYRNPAHLAKIVTTLDIISAGRAILGIGAAWNDDEHDGYGFSFPTVKERMDRLEEALQICRAMFTEEAPSFQGKYSQINGALNHPRPLRSLGIPILIGGGGEQRTLRLVAQYADACNLFGDLDTIKHKLEVLERHCEAVGRDCDEITKTRLGGLIISADQVGLEEKVKDAAVARNTTVENYRTMAIVGTPNQVVDQVGAFLNLGLDGLIFNMPDSQDLAPVALAGETLTKAFP
jgi:F420-dependent oxidoreductase-like protein